MIRMPLFISGCALALALATPAPARDLNSLRREIEAALAQPAAPSPASAAPAAPPPIDMSAASPDEQSRSDVTKPQGYEGIHAVPPGHDGPVATVGVGTTAQAVVNMTSISDYPGPWRATLSRPLMNADNTAVIAPAGAVVVGLTQRASGPNEPIHNRMIYTPLMIRLPGAEARTIPLVGQYQLDGAGVAGVRDKVAYHLDIQAAAVGGSSIADALPSVIAEALGVDQVSRAGDAVVSNLSDQGKVILERFTNLVPTVEVRPGAVVNIFFIRPVEAPVWRTAERYAFERPRP